MALVSLKTESDYAAPMSAEYGYGTSINLTDDQCKALGITSPPPAGTVFAVNALAVAESVTERMEGDEGPQVCMCLQLTAMELTPEKPRTRASMAAAMYGPDAE